MEGFFWRVMFAAFAVVCVFMLIPPFVRLLGFSVNPDLMLIVQICVAAIAVFYVARGRVPQ